jgi:hypothetical protein
MVAVIPVVFCAPAMFVFIPPPMMFAPASFPRFMQLAPLVFGLPAFATVALDSFVQFMLGMRDAPVALLLSLRVAAWPSQEYQSARQCRHTQAFSYRTQIPLLCSIHR